MRHRSDVQRRIRWGGLLAVLAAIVTLVVGVAPAGAADATAPVLAIKSHASAPDRKQQLADSTTPQLLNLSATDDVAVAKFQHSLDGGATYTEIAVTPGPSAAATVPIFQQGKHNALLPGSRLVRGTDPAGSVPGRGSMSAPVAERCVALLKDWHRRGCRGAWCDSDIGIGRASVERVLELCDRHVVRSGEIEELRRRGSASCCFRPVLSRTTPRRERELLHPRRLPELRRPRESRSQPERREALPTVCVAEHRSDASCCSPSTESAYDGSAP